jgi:hypothetical protein
MRFLNRRNGVRIAVAAVAGIVFAITGFRGSAGPASADDSPAPGGSTVVTPAPETAPKLDNWPWG